eukprot:CAMPEP_0201117246 /NCGR_PEP_ID=MMETSP0850-20130426/1257_1 /ASSEMBLY_ACC=CAM_ASM_000622 /TAXON_ID=183588 /ORGANISM="Pseudo-nitzschia fraudulenta, Strain WWA7" /LENGTH=309 /DNA_ID=CAMNT_0047381497 /DNA_START=232 /DNA_END=1161 /DNA_ORIENTATION=-
MPKPSTTSLQERNNTNSAKKKNKKRKQYRPSTFLDCQSLTHVVGFPPQNELVATPVASEFVKEIFFDRFVKEIVKPFQPDKTKKNNASIEPAATPTPTTNADNGYCHVMIGGKLVKKRRIAKDKQPFDTRSATKSTTTTTSPANSHQRCIDETIDSPLARKKRIWKENIVIGTNQCLSVLEAAVTNGSSGSDNDSDNGVSPPMPSLVVLVKDVYPPTLCCAIPVMAKHLRIPVLLIPGKASLELGRALNAKRTSVLVFRCPGGKNNRDTNPNRGVSDNEMRSDKDNEMRDARNAISSFVSFVRDQIPKE